MHKVTSTVLKNRQDLALVILVITFSAGLYIGWHAVPFCQGEIGSPAIWLSDAILSALGEPPMDYYQNPTHPMGILFVFFSPIFYYLTGISGWVTPGLIVIYLGFLVADRLDRTVSTMNGNGLSGQ